uniref:Potassium/proton antiporter CemA n=1 Tax=Chloromonas radiata TaxID=47907 RepID=A0A0S2ICD0_9CHLO|nr:chloroplast enveloppe membrane protein [Chloromonas radiata]
MNLILLFFLFFFRSAAPLLQNQSQALEAQKIKKIMIPLLVVLLKLIKNSHPSPTGINNREVEIFISSPFGEAGRRNKNPIPLYGTLAPPVVLEEGNKVGFWSFFSFFPLGEKKASCKTIPKLPKVNLFIIIYPKKKTTLEKIPSAKWFLSGLFLGRFFFLAPLKKEKMYFTYEEIGLFPRSFSRVLDRFLKQLFSDVENLVLQEYRFYRYLFLTTVKCVFILFFVPFLVNLLAKNYLVRPLTEYFWNTKQTEIFLNSYQQKHAFAELQDFEEKLYFESLVVPNTFFSDSKNFAQLEKTSSARLTQLKKSLKKGGALKAFFFTAFFPSAIPYWKEEVRCLDFYTSCIGNKAFFNNNKIEARILNFRRVCCATSCPPRFSIPSASGAAYLNFFGPFLPHPSALTPFIIRGGVGYPLLVKGRSKDGDAFLNFNLKGVGGQATLQANPVPFPPSFAWPSATGVLSSAAFLPVPLLYPSLPVPLLPLDGKEGYKSGTGKEGYKSGTGKEGFLLPSSRGVRSKSGTNFKKAFWPASFFFFHKKGLLIKKPWPFYKKTKKNFRGSYQAAELLGTSRLKSFFLRHFFQKQQSCLVRRQVSLRKSFQKAKPLEALVAFKSVLLEAFRSNKSFEEKTVLSKQLRCLELAISYNNQSIEAITNFFADLMSFITLWYLLVVMEIQINITKSFLLEVFFGLDDSKKSLLILLVTDLLVGYHSPNIWELFFQFLFNHYGLPESQTGIFLLVATLPVLLDVLFKYLIFRHLNRASPATVATYHAMIE